MIEQVILWKPILWTLRAAILILLVGVGFCGFLYFARFFRPRNIWFMLTADMPRISEIGGEVAGNKLGVKLDHRQDRQLDVVRAELEELKRAQTLHGEAVRTLTAYIQRTESGDEHTD